MHEHFAKCLYDGTHIGKSHVHVWRAPIYVPTSFYIQLIFFLFRICKSSFSCNPKQEIWSYMYGAWLSSYHLRTGNFFLPVHILGLPIWVWAAHMVSWKTLIHVWSFFGWPDTYGHALRLCSYVSGQPSNDRTCMGMCCNCARTCLVIFLHDQTHMGKANS